MSPKGNISSRDVMLQYYTQQSIITNPRMYAYLFDPLPNHMAQLIKIVQGLLISLPWKEVYSLNTTQERNKEIYLRFIPEMLKCILELDSSSLIVKRSPQKRKISLCRDFAVLLVSILRHKSVAARVRVGFAGYYKAESPRYWDHRIAEYWDNEQNRWIFVDAMTEEPIFERLRIKINPLDIEGTSQFLSAGEVWQRCRARKAESKMFGDSPDDLGMSPIRYALLQDFDYLNKNELTGYDAWHNLIDKPETELSEKELVFLDNIAEITNHVNIHFNRLNNVYQKSSYGQAIQKQLTSIDEKSIKNYRDSSN